MRGVVSRLTNRIFGLAPVARLRLPTRFELSGAAFATGAEPAEMAAEAPAVLAPQPWVSQVIERWTVPAQPLQHPEAGKPKQTVAPKDEPRTAAPSVPALAPRQATERDAPPAALQPAGARAPRADAVPRAAPPLAGPQSVAAQPPQPPAAAVVADTGAAPRPTPSRLPGLPALPEVSRSRREAPITAPAAAAPALPPVRPAVPVQPVPQAPAPLAAAPAAAPLEIIIGRIDVRAPAPRAPATRGVSAGLQRIPSLAAYLQTRR